MLIKFFRNGKGAGAGPVGYLVTDKVLAYNDNRDLIRDSDGQLITVTREPLPEVLRGNPDRTEALIDASRHQWTYRAGVISFAATDTTTEEQQAEVKHVLPVKGCSDITYIPVKNGFLYLVAIMDWATRKILTWRLSNTLDVSFCVEALEEAIALYGKPEIMNTDQGRQYTGAGWITTLTNADIKISMPLGRLLCNRLPGNGRLPSKTDHRYLDWILQLITPSHGP